jgi:Cu(I)/Ag(I) efflux system membrane protein CusA/SilA
MFLVFVLLSLNTRSFAKTAIVLLAVPFSAVGAVWYLYLLGYNMSIAVWVGLIALLGVDAETGIFMLLYLNLAYEKASREGRLRTLADLQEIVEGAAKRLRPSSCPWTMFVGLIPIMCATGTGSDVWKRNRRADGWRHLYLVRPRASRLSGHLRNLEVALRAEARLRRAAARRARRLAVA